MNGRQDIEMMTLALEKAAEAAAMGEVPVGEIVSMFHGRWHNTMLPGRAVARIWNPMRFAKHAFFKSDGSAYLLEAYDPKGSARRKEILKAAKRY